MNRTFKLALMVLSVAATLGVRAETLQEAKALQDAALAEIKAKGLDTAIKDFNAGGKWRKGALYLVVTDFKGDMLAHSANDKIIGKNMLEAKDAAGKPFVKDTIAAVNGTGSAQFDIRWGHPATKQIADATFLARRVPGTEVYVGTVVFK